MATRYSLKQIKELPPGLHKVEKGLFIYVSTESRSWVYIFSYEGKQRKLGLGPALEVPLTVAKNLKAQAQGILLSGKNPIEVKRAEKEKNKPIPKEATLFKDFWEPVLERITTVKKWKNAKHRGQWRDTIKTYALPVLSDIPIDKITRKDILKVLEPIWTTKNETASRLRGRLEMILGYAVRDGLIQINPAVWKQNLEFYLAGRSMVQEEKHYATMSHTELKEKFKQLKLNNISHATIAFTILTAVRIGESAPAKWEEFDFKEMVWSIPPERRKDKKKYPHRVPLSAQLVELLNTLPRVSDYVFPGTGKAEHVNKETPRVTIQRLFKTKATMHGMRSTFRDWCAEVGVRDMVAEKCLMHAVGNKVQQAYQRSDLLEQRRVVMQQWADYLTA